MSIKKYGFEIVTPSRIYVLAADNESSLYGWLKALEEVTFGSRLHQGWMIKRGNMRKSWRKRWFVVFDNHEMRYYENESMIQPRGLIKLDSVLLMCPG